MRRLPASVLSDAATHHKALNYVIISPMHDNLQIPYGIFDFKRIRTEGYY